MEEGSRLEDVLEFEEKKIICERELRSLELRAYGALLTAFRAAGDLDEEKRDTLSIVRQSLNIDDARHKAEVRRVATDPRLCRIADSVNGFNTIQDWRDEGFVELPSEKTISRLSTRSFSRRLKYEENAEDTEEKGREIEAKIVPLSSRLSTRVQVASRNDGDFDSNANPILRRQTVKKTVRDLSLENLKSASRLKNIQNGWPSTSSSSNTNINNIDDDNDGEYNSDSDMDLKLKKSTLAASNIMELDDRRKKSSSKMRRIPKVTPILTKLRHIQQQKASSSPSKLMLHHEGGAGRKSFDLLSSSDDSESSQEISMESLKRKGKLKIISNNKRPLKQPFKEKQVVRRRSQQQEQNNKRSKKQKSPAKLQKFQQSEVYQELQKYHQQQQDEQAIQESTVKQQKQILHENQKHLQNDLLLHRASPDIIDAPISPVKTGGNVQPHSTMNVVAVNISLQQQQQQQQPQPRPRGPKRKISTGNGNNLSPKSGASKPNAKGKIATTKRFKKIPKQQQQQPQDERRESQNQIDQEDDEYANVNSPSNLPSGNIASGSKALHKIKVKRKPKLSMKERIHLNAAAALAADDGINKIPGIDSPSQYIQQQQQQRYGGEDESMSPHTSSIHNPPPRHIGLENEGPLSKYLNLNTSTSPPSNAYARQPPNNMPNSSSSSSRRGLSKTRGARGGGGTSRRGTGTGPRGGRGRSGKNAGSSRSGQDAGKQGHQRTVKPRVNQSKRKQLDEIRVELKSESESDVEQHNHNHSMERELERRKRERETAMTLDLEHQLTMKRLAHSNKGGIDIDLDMDAELDEYERMKLARATAAAALTKLNRMPGPDRPMNPLSMSYYVDPSMSTHMNEKAGTSSSNLGFMEKSKSPEKQYIGSGSGSSSNQHINLEKYENYESNIPPLSGSGDYNKSRRNSKDSLSPARKQGSKKHHYNKNSDDDDEEEDRDEDDNNEKGIKSEDEGKDKDNRRRENSKTPTPEKSSENGDFFTSSSKQRESSPASSTTSEKDNVNTTTTTTRKVATPTKAPVVPRAPLPAPVFSTSLNMNSFHKKRLKILNPVSGETTGTTASAACISTTAATASSLARRAPVFSSPAASASVVAGAVGGVSAGGVAAAGAASTGTTPTTTGLVKPPGILPQRKAQPHILVNSKAQRTAAAAAAAAAASQNNNNNTSNVPGSGITPGGLAVGVAGVSGVSTLGVGTVSNSSAGIGIGSAGGSSSSIINGNTIGIGGVVNSNNGNPSGVSSILGNNQGLSTTGLVGSTTGGIGLGLGVPQQQTASTTNLSAPGSGFVNNIPISSIQTFPASGNTLSGMGNAIPIGPVRTSQGANIIFVHKGSGAGGSSSTTTVTSQIGGSSGSNNPMTVGALSMHGTGKPGQRAVILRRAVTSIPHRQGNVMILDVPGSRNQVLNANQVISPQFLHSARILNSPGDLTLLANYQNQGGVRKIVGAQVTTTPSLSSATCSSMVSPSVTSTTPNSFSINPVTGLPEYPVKYMNLVQQQQQEPQTQQVIIQQPTSTGKLQGKRVNRIIPSKDGKNVVRLSSVSNKLPSSSVNPQQQQSTVIPISSQIQQQILNVPINTSEISKASAPSENLGNNVQIQQIEADTIQIVPEVEGDVPHCYEEEVVTTSSSTANVISSSPDAHNTELIPESLTFLSPVKMHPTSSSCGSINTSSNVVGDNVNVDMTVVDDSEIVVENSLNLFQSCMSDELEFQSDSSATQHVVEDSNILISQSSLPNLHLNNSGNNTNNNNNGSSMSTLPGSTSSISSNNDNSSRISSASVIQLGNNNGSNSSSQMIDATSEIGGYVMTNFKGSSSNNINDSRQNSDNNSMISGSVLGGSRSSSSRNNVNNSLSLNNNNLQQQQQILPDSSTLNILRPSTMIPSTNSTTTATLCEAEYSFDTDPNAAANATTQVVLIDDSSSVPVSDMDTQVISEQHYVTISTAPSSSSQSQSPDVVTSSLPLTEDIFSTALKSSGLDFTEQGFDLNDEGHGTNVETVVEFPFISDSITCTTEHDQITTTFITD